ncbi:MAG: hypothetical protein ABWX82_05145 [Leifsonia sp.]
MTTTLEIRSLSAPAALPVRVSGLDFVPVRESLWRVTSVRGGVRGHIERVTVDGSPRYTARLSRGGGRTVPIGEFWTAQAAAESLA